MTGCTHQPQEQRYQIYALMKANFTLTQTAAEIGAHKSAVSREVRRNLGGRGYRPKQARQLTTARKLAASTTRTSTATWSLVESRLRDEQWSPEQISGWLRRNQQPSVSPERIYQYVYAGQSRRWHALHSLALPETAPETLRQLCATRALAQLPQYRRASPYR